MPFRSQHLSCCLRYSGDLTLQTSGFECDRKKQAYSLKNWKWTDSTLDEPRDNQMFVKQGCIRVLMGPRTGVPMCKISMKSATFGRFQPWPLGQVLPSTGRSVYMWDTCMDFVHAAGRGSSGRDSSGSDSPQQARRIRQRSERPDPAPRDPLNGPHPGIERNAGRRAILSVP